ncbi:putative amidohydrolase 3 [Phaeomoniella chlamydospora]|uniref:Putative amidohydrolase 3 n=1 Tax=Phaeomoniella chlamydospora TaxID=158046 RepID=A0A0G2DXQ4_PHACM|nr:putative amidohydrolase 3 [Phaeomoniella chlamydospora]
MSHAICQPEKQGFPPSLWEIYYRYKQSTKAITQWLVKNGRCKQNPHQNVSISDLHTLADRIQAENISLPNHIDFHFRETIRDRKRLTKYYSKASSSEDQLKGNESHEYFTTCLQQIYDRLRDNRAEFVRRDSGIDIGPVNGTSSPYGPKLSNAFEKLAVEGSRHAAIEIAEDENDYESEYSLGQSTYASGTSNEVFLSIEDDLLAQHFEMVKMLKSLTNSFTVVQQVWEDAGRGEVPIIVATMTTTMCFRDMINALAVSQIEKADCHCDREKLPIFLPDHWLQLLNHLPTRILGDDVFELSRELEENFELLIHRKSTSLPYTPPIEAPYCQKPTAFYNTDEATSNFAKKAIIESIQFMAYDKHNIPPNVRHNHAYRLASPLWDEADCWLLHQHDTHCGVICGIGIQGIHKSQERFMISQNKNAKSSVRNCRLETLHFASNLNSDVKEVLDHPTLPCRCQASLALRMEHFSDMLENVCSERAFDLYTQSPWVSGSHMLFLYFRGMIWGLRLLNYRNYFGSILHLYNMLVSLGLIKQSIILEAFCLTFQNIVFRAGRPKKNFFACYFRFLGGRLYFRNGRHNHADSFCGMKVDSKSLKDDTASESGIYEANDHLFHPKNLSLYLEILMANLKIPNNAWRTICDPNLASSKNTLKDTSKTPTTSHPLLNLQSHILRHEFQFQFPEPPPQQNNKSPPSSNPSNPAIPRLPAPLLNPYKIYLFITSLVHKISSTQHSDIRNLDPHERDYCLCFTDMIFRTGDRISALNLSSCRPEPPKRKGGRNHNNNNNNNNNKTGPPPSPSATENPEHHQQREKRIKNLLSKKEWEILDLCRNVLGNVDEGQGEEKRGEEEEDDDEKEKEKEKIKMMFERFLWKF